MERKTRRNSVSCRLRNFSRNSCSYDLFCPGKLKTHCFQQLVADLLRLHVTHLYSIFIDI